MTDKKKWWQIDPEMGEDHFSFFTGVGLAIVLIIYIILHFAGVFHASNF